MSELHTSDGCCGKGIAGTSESMLHMLMTLWHRNGFNQYRCHSSAIL